VGALSVAADRGWSGFECLIATISSLWADVNAIISAPHLAVYALLGNLAVSFWLSPGQKKRRGGGSARRPQRSMQGPTFVQVVPEAIGEVEGHHIS
jgi:hypothetical protein